MSSNWVLIAEKSGASVFERRPRERSFRLVKTFTHSRGRLSDRSLAKAQAGTTASKTNGARHVLVGRVAPRKLEEEKFARLLCDYLDSQYRAGVFVDLIIVASPEFLGLIRKNLCNSLKKSVVRELSKEFPNWLSHASLMRHLDQDLNAPVP